MCQLTVRGFDAELSRCIRGLAVRDGHLVERAVSRLLRRGAGLKRASTGGHVVVHRSIAAHALQARADLVSCYQHFEQIDGLAPVRLPAE